VREFFVRFLANLPNLERRWPGFFQMGKGLDKGQKDMTASAALHQRSATTSYQQHGL
jgi:hypothetical protein